MNFTNLTRHRALGVSRVRSVGIRRRNRYRYNNSIRDDHWLQCGTRAKDAVAVRWTVSSRCHANWPSVLCIHNKHQKYVSRDTHKNVMHVLYYVVELATVTVWPVRRRGDAWRIGFTTATAAAYISKISCASITNVRLYSIGLHIVIILREFDRIDYYFRSRPRTGATCLNRVYYSRRYIVVWTRAISPYVATLAMT